MILNVEALNDQWKNEFIKNDTEWQRLLDFISNPLNRGKTCVVTFEGSQQVSDLSNDLETLKRQARLIAEVSEKRRQEIETLRFLIEKRSPVAYGTEEATSEILGLKDDIKKLKANNLKLRVQFEEAIRNFRSYQRRYLNEREQRLKLEAEHE